MDKGKRSWAWLLAIAAVVLYCIALGEVPLRDWDEGTYAIIAREMFTSSEWLYPTLHNVPFWEKPPLVYWLMAGSYHLGGVSELTSRLALAVLSSLAVPLLYGIGCQAFGQSLPALWGAIAYLTTLPVVRHGRLAMHDGLAVTCFLFALWCLLKGRKQPVYLTGFGMGMGLVVLSKGLLAVLLGAIALFFCLWAGLGNLWLNSWFLAGVGAGLVPVLGWYGLQWQAYGRAFIQVHFFAQSFDRISQVVHSNTGPVWYYLVELVKYAGVWLAFIPGGIRLAWQGRQQLWAKLVLVGIIGYLGTISLMTTKLPWYIMPLYPFTCLAVGAKLAQLWSNPRLQRWFWLGWLVFLSLGAVVGLGYFWGYDRQPILVLMAGVLGLALAYAAWLVCQGQNRYLIAIAAGCYGALVLLMASPVWLWELNEAFAVKPVAAMVRANTPSQMVVYTSFSYHRPSLNFYSDRQIKPESPTRLQQIWSTTSQPYFLLDFASRDRLNLPQSRSLAQTDQFVLLTKF